jgi:AcrR family transcriptional regulator
MARKPSTRRVRRGNEDDKAQLKFDLLSVAYGQFVQGGVEAISMRGIAAAIGVSAMTPYRYFENKAAIIRGLWPYVLGSMYESLKAPLALTCRGREKQRALCNAVLDYWEANPSQYKLVYLCDGGAALDAVESSAHVPLYGESLDLNFQTMLEFAQEIGGDIQRVRLANEMRFAMLLGFAHASIVTTHYPWTDRAALRTHYVDQVVQAVERFLLEKQ